MRPLRHFKEFRVDQDDILVYAITGPHDGGMIILTRDPVELYSSVQIYLEERIDGDELRFVKSLVSEDRWSDPKLEAE